MMIMFQIMSLAHWTGQGSVNAYLEPRSKRHPKKIERNSNLTLSMPPLNLLKIQSHTFSLSLQIDIPV